MISLKYLICLAGCFAIGCGSLGSDQTDSVPTAKAAPLETASSEDSHQKKTSEPTEKRIGGMKFEIPPGWEEKSLSNSMILAEYGLPGSAGEGRLTFSVAGGGTSANMDRWKGQFQRGTSDPEPTESQITVAGKTVTLIEVSGTFSDTFGGGGPKANWQLLGVAIPIDSQENYFVKLTGPRATISEHRDEFMKLIGSARFD